MLTQETSDERISPPRAARFLDCSERTIYRKIKSGELPAERIGHMLRIKVSDLEALGQEVNPTTPDPIREAALRVVSEAPKLTAEQLDKICSLLRGVA